MANYTVLDIKDTKNWFEGKYPGEMRFLKRDLNNEQVAVTYRRMPTHTGAKGSHGHYHKTQEEIVYILSGKIQVKLDDEIKELTRNQAVRIGPGVTWGMWNDEKEDVELLIISTFGDPKEDAVFVEDFWPAD